MVSFSMNQTLCQNCSVTTWTGLLTVTTTSDNQQLQSDNKQSQSLSGNTNNLSLNDNQNQSSQQINSSNHNSSTNILAGNSNQDQSHLNISKTSMMSSGTNDCTKIKFSSKGLTAQQLQLIEQLFKQSKNNKNVANPTNNNFTSSSISTGASGRASGTASEATGKTASNNNPTLAPPAPLNPNIKKNNNGAASGKNHSRFEIQNGLSK